MFFCLFCVFAHLCVICFCLIMNHCSLEHAFICKENVVHTLCHSRFLLAGKYWSVPS